jgi:hypothetical protein
LASATIAAPRSSPRAAPALAKKARVVGLKRIGNSSAHLHQRVGELIDGIVAHRRRAVPAGVGRLDAVMLRGLLADMDAGGEQIAMPVGAPAATLVEREAGGDQLGPVLRQPLGAIERRSALLATGQRQLDRAFGAIAALAEAQHRIDPDRVHRLHVGGAAAVEIAILLDHDIGVARPVGALRRDHVEMAEQQQRLQCFRRAGQDDDQPALLRPLGDREARDVGIAIAGAAQMPLDLVGQRGATAGGRAGVGLDELAIEVAETALIRRQRAALRLRRERQHQSRDSGQPYGFAHLCPLACVMRDWSMRRGGREAGLSP